MSVPSADHTHYVIHCYDIVTSFVFLHTTASDGILSEPYLSGKSPGKKKANMVQVSITHLIVLLLSLSIMLCAHAQLPGGGPLEGEML